MDLNQKLFKNITFADLLSEIHDKSSKKEKIIKDLIEQLKPMVKESGDAVILVPLIKGYLEVAVKNDEHHIKMAAIIQKAMTNTSEEDVLLSEKDKENLYSELHKLK